MRILDRYTLKKVALSYLFTLFSFIGLYLIAELFTNLDDFIRAKASITIVAQYYLYLLPFIFLNTSTFALSIGIAYSLGELNKSNELIYMRTSGVSVWRTAAPIIIFSILLSLVAFFIQEKIIIYSQKKAEDIKINYIEYNNKEIKEQSNIIFYSDEKLFIADKFIPQENRLENVKILEEDSSGNIIKRIVCQSITYKNNIWTARNAIYYDVDKAGKIINKPTIYKEKQITLNEKPKSIVFKSLSGKQSFSMYIPMSMLKKKIENIKRMGMTSSKLLNKAIVDYHEKITSPLSHFFITIGLLPFALEIRKRKAALLSLVLGVIFGIIYFAMFSISIPLGRTALIIPQLSAWITPLFFLTTGISGMFFVK